MSRWTSEQSSLMSLMLEEVVGTREMIEIRKDYCKLTDCLQSDENGNSYFTGSKAEGLDLPGSDKDYMKDFNDYFGYLKVVQTLHEIDDTNSNQLFQMCTENVHPGFALLQYISKYPCSRCSRLLPWIHNLNGVPYLGSDVSVQLVNNDMRSDKHYRTGITTKRQGPSIEHWSEYDDQSESGTDFVPSIHCSFWPNIATEWTQRPRYFEWPYPRDITSIVDFGCHLVPVGHPHSDTKLTEWRISFSMAERALVWSFNHIQMQCYALMKIILKEFIKVKCTSQNFVLCSYFIKTFLFWKYETTALKFWCSENLRECFHFLLIEFYKCIRRGILKHYFIPSFNLLSVKLTREAQVELLQIIDIAIQSDISIFRECKTLQGIWSTFLSANENKSRTIRKIERENVLRNDEIMMDKLYTLSCFAVIPRSTSLLVEIIKLLSVYSRTHLKSLLIKRLLQIVCIRSLMSFYPGNKSEYQLQKIVQNDTLSTDISTCKLWFAFLHLMKGNYTSALSTVNEMLSNITPFSLYAKPKEETFVSAEAKELYKDMFLESRETILKRAKRAWLLDFVVDTEMFQFMPLAIQIELNFCNAIHRKSIYLSPFMCAYYLMFLCYHELHQYNERNRTLDELVNVAKDPIQCHDSQDHCLNIAGHCLYLAGIPDGALDKFMRSLQTGLVNPVDGKYNSAIHYIRHLFNVEVNVDDILQWKCPCCHR